MKSLTGILFIIIINSTYAQMPEFSCSSGNNYLRIQGEPFPVQPSYIHLPFTFTYFGVGYNEVTPSYSGYVAMGINSSGWTINNLCTTNPALLKIVCGFWDDLNPQAGGTTQYTFLGSAPNRVFVAQWDSVRFFSGPGSVTFQIRLYETTNIIEIIYGPGGNNPAASGSIGINDSIGGPGHVLSITPGSTCANTTFSTTNCNNNVPYTNLPSGLKYTFTPVVGIQPVSSEIPDEFKLSQNYPNPFNSRTEIEYHIPRASFVTIKIYDILGNEIATLVSANLIRGIYNTDFDAANLPSGMYSYRLESNGITIDTKKMILVK